MSLNFTHKKGDTFYEVDFEIKSGDWDNCDPNVIATRRTGSYVVINKVYPK